jgi:nitrogen regulatory protein PII-like uncharacterized protein
MDINQIWQTVEPWIMAIVGALAGGTGVFALVRAFVGKWINKFGAKYDTEIMAGKVAEKLAGKTVNIDVTAVAEKKLDKITKTLDKRIADVEKAAYAYKHILALIAGAVSRFKALTDEERKDFADAIKAIEKDYTPPQPEPIATVKLAPIELEFKTDETQLQEEESLINFGGLK